MAFNVVHCLKVIILFLCFWETILKSYSWSNTEKDTDYNKWISRNIKNYQKRNVNFKEEMKKKKKAPEGVGDKTSLDLILRKAETNKVTLSVGQNGTANFKTITEALNSIPPHNTRRFILIIKPGVYREKIYIPRSMPFVTLLGDANNKPIITGNDTASSMTGKGGTPLGTFQSCTVAVEATYFTAVNIIFENTAAHEVGKRGEQGVAVRISGTKAGFYNCSFFGAQDTLYDHKGLHYFNNCFIQGSVDFIFGYARSLYENCYLNSVAKKAASLTAQKRSNSSLESGFSFKDCVVTGNGMGHVYLGRAWGEYSRVVFSLTYMDKTVFPNGWSDWGDQMRDLRVYYGEYKCSGPGANLTARVPWARILTDEEAQPFMGTYYIDGDTWLISPYY